MYILVTQALEELYLMGNELSVIGLEYIIDALQSTQVSLVYTVNGYFFLFADTTQFECFK